MKLNREKLEKNFTQLSTYLLEHQSDALYLSGSDYYLSEYTAMEDSLRNYMTPFRGSTAEVLIIPSKKIYLFVDGRYHLQAELECAGHDHIEVVKVGTQHSLFQELLALAKSEECKVIACIAERTAYSRSEQLKNYGFVLQSLRSSEVEQILEHQFIMNQDPIYVINEKLLPSDYEQKFKKLNLPIKQAIYLSSCDDIAWLSHCRSYQSKGNSYFFSKAVVTSDHLYVFIPNDTKVDKNILKISEVSFLSIDMKNLETSVLKLLKDNGITQVIYDPQTITVQDHDILQSNFEKDDLVKQAYPVTKLRIHKSFAEIKEFERIFLLSSEAIAQTIREAKKSVKDQSPFSEKSLAEKVFSEYKKRGARALSFNTIAGVGQTSAIIHYGACSEQRMLESGQMTLLDSGAYYDSGMATDCTRCFVPEFTSLSEEKKEHFRKLYTLVLKSQLNAEMAVFKPGTLGNAIDQCARGVLLAQGMDFGHGLGHGVGVLVHDPGAGRLSPASKEELHAGVVCSIEPGYYVDGEFGIRLENVVYVTHHAKHAAYLHFKPLVFVGWEEDLINKEMLSNEERQYLAWYQEECRKRGTLTSM